MNCFLIFHYYTITLISDHQKFSVFLWRDIYLSLCTSLSSLFVIVAKLLGGKAVETFNSISDFITNQITSCLFFLIALFEVVLSTSAQICLALLRSF